MKIAYLISQYPMLSMIFVVREVVRLRAMGFEIDTASINAPDRSAEGLTEVEAREAALTHYVMAEGAAGALRAHLAVALERPSSYLAGWWLALRLGGLDARRSFMNVMYLTEALMVGRWMQSRGKRHLHVHLGQQAATVGLFVKQVFACGLSITVHGPDEFYDANGQYLSRKVVAADLICCISHYASSQLMRLSSREHWHKLVVSRLGVDPEVFAPAPRPPLDTDFEVLCIGRLTPAKGQHLLIDAVAGLRRQGRHVRLRVVGAGVDAASLQRHAKALNLNDVVVFEGAVDQDRIRELYARAHCFCLPSFAEGIPVVLMEAMAMGIPCVTTQITGIPELIRHGEEGLLVAPGDTDGLERALATLMDSPGLCEALSEAGRRKVVAQYHLDRNVEHLAGVFRARLGGMPDTPPEPSA